jgi:hypothetical protein
MVEGSWKHSGETGMGAELDAIGWHPFYQSDPGPRTNSIFRDYRTGVAQFKKDCAALGFRGQYAATEWTWAAPYPPAPGFACSEMQKAKYSAQLMTAHAGLDLVSLYNETFQSGKIDWDCNILRNTFQCDPISATQPQPVYYVFRNLSTGLDGFRAAELPVKFGTANTYECYTFKRSNGELLVAAWIPGRTGDGMVEEKTDISLPGRQAKNAWGIDIMNGTEQQLEVSQQDNSLVLENVLLKDYPVLIRLAP